MIINVLIKNHNIFMNNSILIDDYVHICDVDCQFTSFKFLIG